jgi:hypothetical protein
MVWMVGGGRWQFQAGTVLPSPHSGVGEVREFQPHFKDPNETRLNPMSYAPMAVWRFNS